MPRRRVDGRGTLATLDARAETSLLSPRVIEMSALSFASAVVPTRVVAGADRRRASSARGDDDARRASSRIATRAFWKKEAPPPPPPPPPAPKGLGALFGGAKKASSTPPRQQQQVRDVEYVPQETMTDAYARIKKSREQKRKAYEAQEKGGLSLFAFKALSAINFEEDIESDRGLLRAAKSMKRGDKMSREQYNALQRKVGGTKGGFFGENVFAKGEYLDKGYEVSAKEEPVKPLGNAFLYGVLVAVLATTGYVCYAVGQAGAI